MELLARPRWQDPFHQLRVGSRGQVRAAKGRVLTQVFSGRRGHKPILILLERHEEALEPAVAVAVIVGTGPSTKFFAVVAHRGHSAGMAIACAPQKTDDFLNAPERNEISQGKQPGDDPDLRAAVLRQVVAK